MEVRPGYKQTSAGVIPADWDVDVIENLADITTGAKNTQDRIHDGLYPFFVRSQTVERINSYSFDGEAVLTAGDGVGTGKVFHYINGKFDVHQRVYRISNFGERLNGHFFYLYFSTHFFNRIMQMTAKSSVDSVRMDMIARMSVPIPPTKAEQCAIAAALSDVDALLGGLDRLIAKKRDLKQAVMQQLLTGQTRLPGFHGAWEVKRLGEVGTFLKGSGIRKDEARGGNLACIRYGEIYTHHSDYVRSFNSWISRAVADTATPLRCGDILFAGSGETKEEIGKCVAFLDDVEAYAGGDIVILRPTAVDSMFLGYFLNTSDVASMKASRGQGDAVVHISASALASIVLSLPSVDEQCAIASILSAMDAELSALDARRDKTRALKQAMMQELLTGKTRLVVSSSNVVSIDSGTTSKSTSPPQADYKPHNWQINEAVVVAVLVKRFGSEQYPLGRKRCTKLAYLMHRHVEHVAEGYLKKAAGPYNPAVKYKGPERIAQKNGYIISHANGRFSGFVAADKIAQAESYFSKWYSRDVLSWLEQFRRQSNDELEVLATVDMAVEDLKRVRALVSVEAVKSVIREHPEWEAKLERSAFADQRIAAAIDECQRLFSS